MDSVYGSYITTRHIFDEFNEREGKHSKGWKPKQKKKTKNKKLIEKAKERKAKNEISL